MKHKKFLFNWLVAVGILLFAQACNYNPKTELTIEKVSSINKAVCVLHPFI